MCETPLNMIDSSCAVCDESHEYTMETLLESSVSKKYEDKSEMKKEKGIVETTGNIIEMEKGNSKSKRKNRRKIRKMKKQSASENKPEISTGHEKEIAETIGDINEMGKRKLELQTQVEFPIENEQKKEIVKFDMDMENTFQNEQKEGNDQKWECKKCSFPNKKSNEKCEICGNENVKFCRISVPDIKYIISVSLPPQGNRNLRRSMERESKQKNMSISSMTPTGSGLRNIESVKKEETFGEGACPLCLVLKWHCRYQRCGIVNYEPVSGTEKGYCRNCGVHKQFYPNKGMTAQKYLGNIRQVWICCQCLHINKLDWHQKSYDHLGIENEDFVCEKCCWVNVYISR